MQISYHNIGDGFFFPIFLLHLSPPYVHYKARVRKQVRNLEAGTGDYQWSKDESSAEGESLCKAGFADLRHTPPAFTHTTTTFTNIPPLHTPHHHHLTQIPPLHTPSFHTHHPYTYITHPHIPPLHIHPYTRTTSFNTHHPYAYTTTHTHTTYPHKILTHTHHLYVTAAVLYMYSSCIVFLTTLLIYP